MKKNHQFTRFFYNFSNLHEGFTLIELLVVMMIIGILAGIALPTFLAFINKAKSAEGLQNVSYLEKSQASYYVEAGSFTDSVQALGFSSKTETENYSYQTFTENSSINGAIHLALSKTIGVKSYVGVVYLQDGVPLRCEPVEVPLIWPLSSPNTLQIFNEVLSHPEKYCH